MFVGHLAVALIAKRIRPAISLGWLVAAATALDLIWPVLLLLGWEQVRIVPGAMAFNFLVFDSYPWSHSLLMAAVWGVVLAGFARWRGYGLGDGRLLFTLVMSHWVLDFLTHAPDMPLWPGESPHVGLGLWNSAVGTLLLEGMLWVTGIVLYLGPRRATSRVGPIACWSLVLSSTAIWVSSPWSSPPPSPEALGWFALIGWILVPWAGLADRHYTLHPAKERAGRAAPSAD